jgi:hypothetical protein
MADAEDLKSSGDFSSCGFDSHPGHQSERWLRIARAGAGSSEKYRQAIFSANFIQKTWN